MKRKRLRFQPPVPLNRRVDESVDEQTERAFGRWGDEQQEVDGRECLAMRTRELAFSGTVRGGGVARSCWRLDFREFSTTKHRRHEAEQLIFRMRIIQLAFIWMERPYLAESPAGYQRIHEAKNTHN